MSKPLTIKYDQQADVVTIEGTRYHGDLFREWGQKTPVTRKGLSLRVIEKGDGLVTFAQFECDCQGGE